MPDKARILVVDDEPRNVKLLSAHLTGNGFETLAAYNGEQALHKAAREKPDVILLDIMMPDLDGFEVTRRLKADPHTNHIPVVLVTSLDGSDNRVKGLEAGADEFLTKPINSTELLARVRALQRMKQMQDELRIRKQITERIIRETNTKESGQPSVLIVEDDERLRKQISDVLNARGYKTRVVNSVADAREVMAQYAPDLVLLDILLPDGDGLVLLDEWKAHERLQDIPIIIITVLTDLEHKIKAIEQGADDYLIKPVNIDELVARMRASLRRASAQQRLRQDVVRLHDGAVSDRLTGVHNRYYLDSDLNHRFAQAVRDPQRAFSVVMVDIDHFKQFNDQFGHLIGDSVLREVAQCLQQTARTADIVTRYGGEEFCVVLPETVENNAQIAAERLRRAIAEHDFDSVAGQGVTVSLGVATFSTDDSDVTALLTRADEALYAAKVGGRNRVCVGGNPQPSTTPEVSG